MERDLRQAKMEETDYFERRVWNEWPPSMTYTIFGIVASAPRVPTNRKMIQLRKCWKGTFLSLQGAGQQRRPRLPAGRWTSGFRSKRTSWSASEDLLGSGPGAGKACLGSACGENSSHHPLGADWLILVRKKRVAQLIIRICVFFFFQRVLVKLS